MLAPCVDSSWPADINASHKILMNIKPTTDAKKKLNWERYTNMHSIGKHVCTVIVMHRRCVAVGRDHCIMVMSFNTSAHISDTLAAGLGFTCMEWTRAVSRMYGAVD